MSFDLCRESVHHLLETIYQTHSVLINPPLEFVTDFSDSDVFVNVDLQTAHAGHYELSEQCQ